MIGIEQLSRRVVALEQRVGAAPALQQGTITAVTPGPPVSVTVDLGAGAAAERDLEAPPPTWQVGAKY